MQKRILLIFCFVLAVFAISACSDGKDGVDGKDATAAPEVAMSTTGCLTCHSDYKDMVAGSKHIVPSSAYFAPSGEACDKCHNPTGLEYLKVDDTAKGGLACTSCHELDGKVKNNPIHSSYAVTADNCNTCHGDLSVHWANPGAYAHYFPYATNINEKFGTSEQNLPGHSRANGRAYNKETGEPSSCGLCHSGPVFSKITSKVAPRITTNVTLKDGTSAYRTSGGASQKVESNFDSKYAATAKTLHLEMPGSDSITCAACHDPHMLPGERSLRTSNIQVSDKNIASNEFLLCTSCHIANVDIILNRNGYGATAKISELYTGTIDGGNILEGADADLFGHHDTSSRYPAILAGSVSHSILDTHFAGELYTEYAITDNGKVEVKNNAKITVKGYGIAPSSPNACTNCHDVHASSIFEPEKDSHEYKELAETWGASAHANEAGSGTFVNNAGCQPCHGSRNQAVAVHNDLLSQLNGTKPYPTQVGCLTCHEGSEKNIDGATIIDGEAAKKLYTINSAVAFTKSFTFPMSVDQFNDIKAKYPAENVMLCGGCHSGGHGGETVTAAYKDYTDGGKVTFYTGHYDAAFGAMTGVIFDQTNLPANKTYAFDTNVGSHMKDGCIGCHVTNTKDHSFNVYSDKDNMVIKNQSTDCTTQCHTNGSMMPGGSDTKGQIEALQVLLKAVIPNGRAAASGITDASIVANADDRKKIGMALGNLNVLIAAKDKGLYAHLSKKVICEIVYDNMVVLAPYVGLGFDGTGKLSFTGVKTYKIDNNGTIISGKDDEISIVNNMFLLLTSR